MNRKAYDTAGAEITGITVLSCATVPVPKLITDNTLGGSWFVQQVGVAAIKAAVRLSVTGVPARDAILTAWATGTSIKIDYDGYLRTGLIISEPDDTITRPGPLDIRKFTMTFTFAVMIEEVSP